mmetsp:Transcript_16329/g.38640  ORF Transcript_16329/g.38640 Transcript_16329/m.38640 type:complete len:371 (+) Transcript_16329:45-1157(+)
MATKLFVCKSSSCRGLGSDKLIRDLEELCADSAGCQAFNGSCLDHCGKGPNVQVQSKSGKVVIEGVKTFKDVRNLLEKSAGAKIKKLDYQVAEIKYEARRAKGPDRLAKVEKGLKALGGEDKASKEPKLAASLLAFRAEELLRGGGDLENALRDAQRAALLWKGFAPAHLASALALFRLGKAEEARAEMRSLEDASAGTPAMEDRRALMKEAEKHPLEPPPQEKVVEPATAAETASSSAAPPKAAPKAAPKEAPKEAPKAKPKAKVKAKTTIPQAPSAASAGAKGGAAKSQGGQASRDPAETVEQGSSSSGLPMGHVPTQLSTVVDDRSPGCNSSNWAATGFLLSEGDEASLQREISRRPPKGQRQIISL